MTRAALTKLFVLVILAFIICLPEFFTFYRGGSSIHLQMKVSSSVCRVCFSKCFTRSFNDLLNRSKGRTEAVPWLSFVQTLDQKSPFKRSKLYAVESLCPLSSSSCRLRLIQPLSFCLSELKVTPKYSSSQH